MTACAYNGCTGTIEDGYCSVCGLAPAKQGPSAAVPQGSAPVSVTGSARSVRSVPLGVPGASTRTGASSGRASRGWLGAGLVEVPPVPARDPSSAVLTDPKLDENKRFCSKCRRPVGRGSDGAAGRTEGFCRHCGAPFSFTPKLERGEMVGGQYEVLGCLAHGGLGWIYLAMDHNLGKRWVVLKGLLDAGDADAYAAAIAERRFLAEVKHPNIVGVYNFVQHKDRSSGETAGYIVMEYVGGKSLKEIVLERRDASGSLPLGHALAFAIEVLPALGYLHDRGLVYCDFKPDNVIQTEEQLKLIDMGGVRHIDDDDSPIYGTVGYQAPEIASEGPSVSSDLYTVGRTLAVLTLRFTGYTTTYQHSLPGPADAPLLAEQESYRRSLLRATDPDPRRRFASAAEMSEQLTGVLREVLSVEDGQPRAAFSTLFSSELQAVGVDLEAAGQADAARRGMPSPAEIVTGMPVPLVDADDPAAAYLATLSALDVDQQAVTLSAAAAGAQGVPKDVAESAELRLALARAHIVAGEVADAQMILAQLAQQGHADWRADWYQGLLALADGRHGEARAAFTACYDRFPGELAPKLGLAFTAEADGDHGAAARYFEVVWAVDRSYVSAAFGLARCRLASGDRAGAIEALGSVPETSTYYSAAQIAAVRAVVAGRDPAELTAAELHEAGNRLARLRLDAARRQGLAAEVLTAALAWVTAGASATAGAGASATAGAGADGERLLDCELTERGLRLGLERSYRSLARLLPGKDARIELVDKANEVRPRTWW